MFQAGGVSWAGIAWGGGFLRRGGARIDRSAGSDGFGPFLGYQSAMGFPFGPLLGVLARIDSIRPFPHEVEAQGRDDDHRVDGAVETAIAARLQPVQEEHHLGHLQVAEPGDDDVCQLDHLVLVEFLLHAAVLTQVIELGQHPLRRRLVMVGAAQREQGRGRAKVGPLHVGGADVLQLGVHHLHERLQARMALQQGVDFLL